MSFKRFFRENSGLSIIILLVVLYLIFNNIYVTYATGIPGSAKCENNQLVLPNVMGLSIGTMTCSACPNINLDHFKYKENKYCDSYNQPKCDCQSTIYEVYIRPLF